MKSNNVLVLIVSVLALAAMVIAIRPAPEPESEPEPVEPSVMLFDGKTLEGWTRTNFGGEGDVEVRDGAIFMDYGADLTGVHCDWPLEKRVNYELTLEAQRVEGQDFFVGMTFPVKDEYCSLILGGWGGGVCGISSIDGNDASENETTCYENFELGQWYRIRLLVLDDEITVWLDDEVLLHFNTEGKKLSVRFEIGDSQPFGLCTYATQGMVRDIKLKKVDPAKAK